MSIVLTPPQPSPSALVQSDLRLDVQTTSPGLIRMEALPDHRLKIHAGAPVEGSCGAERFVYTRGDTDIIPAGAADVWEEHHPGASLVLVFSPALLRRTAEELALDPDRAGLEPRHQFRDPRIEHIAWAMDAERAAGYPNGRLYTDSLGVALAVHLLRGYSAPAPSARGLSRMQFARVTDYIEAHLDGNLSLERLARLTGLSASHFKTLFRRTTGLPVHEYVVRRRVERARQLLLRGELPGSQIALEAGFSHQSHMARCMRRVLGVTPTSLLRGSLDQSDR